MTSMLQAGFGKVDITPECDGTFQVFEPIYMRALHLRQGGKQVTYLAADLFVFDDGLLKIIADELADTDIDAHWILPGASHMGTGPALFQFYVAQPTEALRHFGKDRKYAQAGARAIRLALEDLAPARIDAAVARAPADLSYNRRAHDAEGNLKIVSLTGYPEPPPDLVYDATDRQFGIVGLQREGARPIILANFGCHALARWAERGNIAGDYPGTLCRLLDDEGFDALFFQGALGNVHPWRKGDDPCGRIASALRDLSLRLFEGLGFDGDQALHRIETALRVSTDERLPDADAAREKWERALEKMEVGEGTDRYWYWLSQRYALDHDYSMPLRAVTFGGAALVHVPGEPFSETAAAIREAVPFERVMILSNPCPEVGYLPTERAHEEGDGEVLFAPLEREAEAKVRREIINLLAGSEPVQAGS